MITALSKWSARSKLPSCSASSCRPILPQVGQNFPFCPHEESTQWFDLLILIYFEVGQTKGMTWLWKQIIFLWGLLSYWSLPKSPDFHLASSSFQSFSSSVFCNSSLHSSKAPDNNKFPHTQLHSSRARNHYQPGSTLQGETSSCLISETWLNSSLKRN